MMMSYCDRNLFRFIVVHEVSNSERRAQRNFEASRYGYVVFTIQERKLIQCPLLTKAEDRERELEKAMRTNCDFREFIDKMVDILDGGETVR